MFSSCIPSGKSWILPRLSSALLIPDTFKFIFIRSFLIITPYSKLCIAAENSWISQLLRSERKANCFVSSIMQVRRYVLLLIRIGKFSSKNYYNDIWDLMPSDWRFEGFRIHTEPKVYWCVCRIKMGRFEYFVYRVCILSFLTTACVWVRFFL